MRFISVRELRSSSSELWDLLKEEEIVLTLNGKPIAVMAGVPQGYFQETLRAIRQARAAMAMESMHKTALGKGHSKISSKEIEAEINAVRRRKDL